MQNDRTTGLQNHGGTEGLGAGEEPLMKADEDGFTGGNGDGKPLIDTRCAGR